MELDGRSTQKIRPKCYVAIIESAVTGAVLAIRTFPGEWDESEIIARKWVDFMVSIKGSQWRGSVTAEF